MSYPGNLPGMLNTPLEPARWLWIRRNILALFGKKMTTKCHILVIYLVCLILHWSPLDGSGVVKIIWHFLAKIDYKVSYPGISPGMLNPPLEPARWLWSNPRLKQAMIQKRCSVVFRISTLQCNKL